jgi:transposase-like protein
MLTSGTPSPEQLYILLARAEREGLDASVIDRLKVILHFAEHRHSISETCRQFGISRSTFHRWIERFDPENLSTLADKSHEPLTLRQSAIDAESVELIRRYRMRYPQMGKERNTDTHAR